MPRCHWYDATGENALCSFISDRQWNLERHLKNMHEDPEKKLHEALENEIQQRTFHNIFPPPPWAVEVGIWHPLPMSTIHFLLIPQISLPYDANKPFASLQDPNTLLDVRKAARKLQKIAASNLRMKFGPTSVSNQSREAALNGQVKIPMNQEFPAGRNWGKEIIVGVKAIPTMNRLSIEVFSKDLVSTRLNAKDHYNALNTPFLISLDDFPISEAELSRRKQALRSPLKCWRCGKVFGNDIASLKGHLEEEFMVWKRE